MKAELLDYMGSDQSIVATARVSFGNFGDWNTLPEDYTEQQMIKLLNYLGSNGHWTPFSHPQITLRVKAPVPIRTQCFKSKIGFVENEESRRYISSTPELFVPDHFRSKPDGNKKQGSGGKHPLSEEYVARYLRTCEIAIKEYDEMIAAGIAPEQARFILPQGCYVNWIWTGSLAAFARFCKLRQDGHAQGEIRDLSDEIIKIIQPLFPYSWKALMGN
jgi:thymidylate synthase (FAD)